MTRFQRLRAVARGYPAAAASVKQLVRSVRNSKIEVVLADPKATPTPQDEAAIEAVKSLLRRPDPRNRHTIKSWLSFGERDIAEIGVFVIWPWRFLDGSLYALVSIDGSTIIPITSQLGSVPDDAEGFAYSQWLGGRNWANFRALELVYAAPDPVPGEIFPRSATDDALGVLTTAVLELIAQQDVAEHHGHLTIFMMGAEGKDADSVTELAAAIELNVNKKLPIGGGVVNVVPVLNGNDIKPLPNLSFDIDREEFRIRMVRQCYGLSPTANVRDNNRGTSETQGDTEEQTVIDRHEWWSELLTMIAQDLMGYPQLEVRLVPRKAKDSLTTAQAHAAELAAGYRDVDEIRKEEGLADAPALQAAHMAKLAAASLPPASPFGTPAPPIGSKAADPKPPTIEGVLEKVATARTEVLQIEAARLLSEKKKAADGGE